MTTTPFRPLPVEVIAEAGVNHDGDEAVAHALVDAAADAGADTVKFQTFDPDALVAAGAPTAAYQRRAGEIDQHALLAGLTLPATVWTELSSHAAERGLRFLSTPFDRRSADLLADLGVDALKVPSGELTNLPFLADLAGRGLPLLVSTGMADLDEVRAAVAVATRAPAVTLLHCVSAYPAPVEQANLRAIATMRSEIGVPVGWSDHTDGELTALGAVALGATVLEKHLTLDRGRAGPDHAASADPAGFASYVAAVRAMETALGDGVKRPVPAEADVRQVARRSWHAVRDLPAGTVLTDADVAALRPGTGVSPAVPVAGRALTRDLVAGEAVRPEDLAADGSGPAPA